MILDDAPAQPAFKEYGLQATKRFLKTAIVIDDEIIAEPTADIPIGEVNEPPFAVLIPEQAEAALAALEEPGKDAEVQIKPLADAFLDKRIVCGVLKPEVADSDDSIIERAVRAAAVADVVIIDWYLRQNQDNLARSILERILKEDQELNGRLRLVIVYTSADPLSDRRKSLAEHLRNAKFDAVEDPDDDMLLTIGACRLRFVRKRSNNVGMAVEDLPDFAVEEFAKLSNGLLANFALLGIAALRDATHHILANLNSGIDSAFVGHRMLLGHDTEARGFAMNLFLLQMRGVLSLPKHLGGALSDDELTAWFDERFDYADADVHLEAAGTTKKELRESILVGTGKLDRAHKLLFLPESDDPQKVGDAEKKLSQDFARFATFVREPQGYNPLPNDWLPTLTLGTVVKCVGTKTRYFLCVQPACDTVRIIEDRYFPFIELVANKVAKSTENLVIRDGERSTVVCVSNIAGSRLYDKFRPHASQSVFGTKSEDGKFLFSSTSERIYWWLGDIDPLKAQRIATDVSGSLARVGIDEYEWLRLGGTAKKK